MYDGWVIKIAIIGIIDRVAENVSQAGSLKNLGIHFAGWGRRDHERNIIQIARFKGPWLPVENTLAKPFLNLRNSPWSHHFYRSACLQQSTDLAFAYWARADHQATTSFEFQENWKHF